LLSNLRECWRDPFGLPHEKVLTEGCFAEKTHLYYDHLRLEEGTWPRQSKVTIIQTTISALEEQIKELEKEVRDLKQKLETHDHPHTH
jgi:predicted nuclease with TOPRIM domain